MIFDPNSFSGKLILNGIDKFVFTLLLMLILAVWTQYQRDYERTQVRAEEVNIIKIQRPIKLVEELSILIRQCMLFMQQVSMLSLPSLTEEDKKQFASLLLDIRLNLEMIKSYSKDRPETTRVAEELQRTVVVMETDILKSKAIKIQNLKELRDQLYEQFVELSDSTIDETTAVISINSGVR